MELFPDNATLLVLGPLVLRWYALAYIGGLVIGWRWLRVLAQRTPAAATPLQVDEFLTWATVGVVLVDGWATCCSTSQHDTSPSHSRSSPYGMVACRSMVECSEWRSRY